jgi:hypothetical protein
VLVVQPLHLRQVLLVTTAMILYLAPLHQLLAVAVVRTSIHLELLVKMAALVVVDHSLVMVV